jgi:hypothetical protein
MEHAIQLIKNKRAKQFQAMGIGIPVEKVNGFNVSMRSRVSNLENQIIYVD